jgi:hypothetical protein
VQQDDRPKRSIQRTRKLGRIAHQSTAIGPSIVDQQPLDSLDPAIHHIARGDAVGAGLCICDGYAGDAFDGVLGHDGAVRVEDTTVAMRGVCAETEVAGHVEGGEGFTEVANGKNDGAIGIVSCRAAIILKFC